MKATFFGSLLLCEGRLNLQICLNQCLLSGRSAYLMSSYEASSLYVYARTMYYHNRSVSAKAVYFVIKIIGKRDNSEKEMQRKNRKKKKR